MLWSFFNKINLKPATLAVLIQATAFFFIVSVTLVFRTYSPNLLDNTPVVFFVLLHGVVAAYFSSIANMEKWWRWIHVVFPLAVWLMSQWQIPNVIYLVGFLLSLGLYWTTFRTQVPFFPSTHAVHEQILSLIPQSQSIRVIDIGSGLGDMCLTIAKSRPACVVEGIEIAPLPWFVSFVRAKLVSSRAYFRIGDYRLLNFADYDLIFAYLSPAAMPDLWKKAQSQMRSGCLLVSYEFEISGVAPTMVMSHLGSERLLYVWKIN